MTFIVQTAVPHPAPVESGPAASSSPSAWRRELEKAAAGGWFHGPLPPHVRGDGALPHGGPAAFAAGLASTKPLPGSRLPSLDPLPVVLHRSVQPSGGKVALLGAHASSQLFAWLQSPESEGSGTPAAAPAARPARADPGQAPVPADRRRPPSAPSSGPVPASSIRVHVEHGDEGVRVWLGIAADPALVSARLKSIVFELRRNLHGAGQRLAEVVCNGEAIYVGGAALPNPASNSSKEPPCP